jgi:hypothetical protein
VYYSPQIAGLQVVLPDQAILSNYLGPQYNQDSSANGSVPGSSMAQKAFTLSAAPVVPGLLIVLVNGILQNDYAFSGQLIVLETAPNPGTVIEAVYSVA